MHTQTAMLTIAFFASTTLAQPAIPTDPEPRWWKGNLHTHTFWSDGNDFPEMVTEWYATHGYNFLALSDHNTLSRGQRWMDIDTINTRSRGSALPAYLERFGESWVETRGEGDALEVRLKPFEEYRALVEERGRFIMLQGEEITGSYDRRPIHINATNLAELVPPQQAESVEATIRKVLQEVNAQAAAHGREILTHLNHPNFGYGITAEDIAPVLEEQFFEVFNGHTGVNNAGDEHHASTERIWDIVNTIRVAELDAPPIFGIATDDSHSYHEHSPVSIPGRGWVMVRATHLTPESLIRAMNAGDFYASTGVTLDTIEFDADAQTLTIGIRPVAGETYTTRFVGTLRGTPLDSTPILDSNGNEIVATRRYAPEIGRTLAEVVGTTAAYTLTGEELYVRAVIESDAAPDRPTRESLVRRAWTQPITPRLETDAPE
ncbi:MAG: hypothetical protein Q9O74_06365 [Planctomycetota bacterium]|nr:hypothetical protein [Planctomycetota bacterium]